MKFRGKHPDAKSVTTPPQPGLLRCHGLLLFLFALMLSGPAQAAEKRSVPGALTRVARIAIVTPFFCTDTLKREAKNNDQQAYRETLRLLESTFQKRLPRSLGESQQFRVAPPELVDRKLRALGWMPQDLYEDEAALQRGWPQPVPKRAATLAKVLNVDAVFLAVMRDPASVKEGFRLHRQAWNINPFNLQLRRYPNHVTSPVVRAFLYDAKGDILWQDQQMADHPRTKPHTARTLRADWQEATLQVAQQLTDNLMREVIVTQQEGLSTQR